MSDSKEDLLYYRACEFVLRTRKPSMSLLQRKFRVGYKQAGRWLDRMEENGVIKVPKDRLH